MYIRVCEVCLSVCLAVCLCLRAEEFVSEYLTSNLADLKVSMYTILH